MIKYCSILQLPKSKKYPRKDGLFLHVLHSLVYSSVPNLYIPMFWLVDLQYCCWCQISGIFATCISDIPIFGQLPPSSNLTVFYCKPPLSHFQYVNHPTRWAMYYYMPEQSVKLPKAEGIPILAPLKILKWWDKNHSRCSVGTPSSQTCWTRTLASQGATSRVWNERIVSWFRYSFNNWSW
jgi:hypothetical protein